MLALRTRTRSAQPSRTGTARRSPATSQGNPPGDHPGGPPDPPDPPGDHPGGPPDPPGRPGGRARRAAGPARAAGGAAVTALVSVVVPTRNAGRTIEVCLRSIRAQTWPALELIVVDNGSSDATWAVARRHADLALRGGPERSAQRNLGIAHAAGEG